METASNLSFRRNLFHEALYSWHVVSDRTILNPGTTPYYDEEFCKRIKGVKEEGLLNVSTMSSSIWYRVLLENNVTHRVVENVVQEVKPCRTELSHPDKNWEQIWFLALNPGLPSNERLHRMNMPNIPNPLM